MEVGDVAEEWIAVRAQVRPRLILPAHDRLQDPRDFGEETLLPALANAPDGRLKDLRSTAMLSISNCAEFERDMKAIRELWRKRTKRIDPQRLGMQIRLSLNHQARQREGAISLGLEAEISALEKAWLETEHRACRTRKRRSDALGPGSRGRTRSALLLLRTYLKQTLSS